MEGDGLGGQSHAHQTARSPQALEGAVEGGLRAGDVDGRVHAHAAGQSPDLRRQVALGAVEHRVGAHLLGHLQLLIDQVAGDDLDSAEGLAGADGCQTDGSAAADQHGLSVDLRRFHAVNPSAHGLEHAGRLVGDVILQQERAVPADLGVFGEGSVLGAAEQLHVLADVWHPVLAEIALAAGNMGLAGHPVAHLALRDVFSHCHDLAGCLMAHGNGGLDPLLGPLVPFHDVQIRAADGRAVDLDEDFIVIDLRDRQVSVIDQAGRGVDLLDKAAHGILHCQLLLFDPRRAAF